MYCRYVRFWDAFDSFVVQAAAVTEGLVCNYSSDGAVLAVGLVDNFHFCCQCNIAFTFIIHVVGNYDSIK